MMTNLRERLHYHFHHPNYLIFLISLVLLILAPPLASLLNGALVMFKVLFGVVIFVGTFYLSRSLRELTLMLGLGALLYLSFIEYVNYPTFSWLGILTNLSFFGYLFLRLVYFIFRTPKVNENTLYASISAFLLLGLMGVPLCSIIQYYIPGAFNMPPSSSSYDFLYYCFVTITTVGYGDITPVHSIAKSVAILLSVSGQLYITFIIGIIIGKYLADDSRKKEANQL